MSKLASIADTPLYRVVDKAGGVSALARTLGVSRQVLYVWLQRGFVPLERAVEIEGLYGEPRAGLIDPKLRVLLGASVNTADHVPYKPRS